VPEPLTPDDMRPGLLARLADLLGWQRDARDGDGDGASG
jgi:hypothetical protein